MMWLLSHQLETGLLVDVASRDKNAVGPEHHLLIPPAARETDALLDEARAQPQATGSGFDEQEPEFRDRFAALYDKDGANNFSIHLRDPAAFSFRIVIIDEIRHDLGDKRLKMLVPAILLRVEDAMPVGNPAHVSRLVWTENKGFRKLKAFRKQAFDRLHGFQKTLLILFAELAQHL